MNSMSELSFTSVNDTNQGHNSVANPGEGPRGPAPHPLGVKKNFWRPGTPFPHISRSGSSTAIVSEDNPIFLEDNAKYNT